MQFMASANFLQHGLEICFGISCVSAAQDGGIEISYVAENVSFIFRHLLSKIGCQVWQCRRRNIPYLREHIEAFVI
jgi:hypothetical protein